MFRINSCTHSVVRHLALGMWVIVAMLAGCVTRHYELEMEPADDGKLQRTLTTSARQSTGNEKRPLDEKELARIAAVYGTDVPQGDGPEHSFTGRFSDRTPDDLGGAGTFTQWVTSLGSTTGYLERVRGDDDIATSLERRRGAADRLIDLLIGWSETELSGAPELPKVREFLNTSFRRDLINLGIYVEATGLVDIERSNQQREGSTREQGEMEVVARMIQYCVERNYVPPQQLPEWYYAFDQADQQRPGLLIELVQRTVATKIGIASDDPIPACLTRWSNIDDLNESLCKFLRETDEYRALKAKGQQSPAAQRPADPPDPYEIVADLVAAAVFPTGLFAAGDRLAATLTTKTEPLATNGRWNGEKQCVEWSLYIEGHRSDGERRSLPGILYAVWTEPAVEAQTRHFGKVVLAGDSLFAYCLWRQGLTAEKARVWDEFLASLRPGPDLADRIRAFRFDDEPANTHTRSQSIRELLAGGLP